MQVRMCLGVHTQSKACASSPVQQSQRESSVSSSIKTKPKAPSGIRDRFCLKNVGVSCASFHLSTVCF